MGHSASWDMRLVRTLTKAFNSRAFYIISFTSLIITIAWIQLIYVAQFASFPTSTEDSLVKEALENVAQDHRYAEIYRKSTHLPSDLKYILLWTRADFAPFNFFGKGQRAFIEKNCSTINCYVTSDRKFFGVNITRFDAIAFNGRNIMPLRRSSLPTHRNPHQKYIYFNMESADNFPVCNRMYDDFFNWTSTYRLDSDITYPYIMIKNMEGEVVGPRANMEWIEDMHEIDDDVYSKLVNKSKAAAWFVSHCASKSGRQDYAKKLEKALASLNLALDVYGKCGKHKCPVTNKTYCDDMLERDYYFYLSFENSFAEDYVTEKLLTALNHYAIPIVYGGANYSRFLPPDSYIDALQYTPEQLAKYMHHLIQSPRLYSQYFKWRYHYVYHEPANLENVCAVCDALNNRTKVNTKSVYTNFREWWYPNYKELKECK